VHNFNWLGLINLAATLYLIWMVRRRIKTVMADLTRLKESVANSITIEKSAKALIEGLAQQLRDSADDPAAIKDLADQLDAEGTDLAGSITANTGVSSTGTGGTNDPTAGGATGV
jgi:hypothetical protein